MLQSNRNKESKSEAVQSLYFLGEEEGLGNNLEAVREAGGHKREGKDPTRNHS